MKAISVSYCSYGYKPSTLSYSSNFVVAQYDGNLRLSYCCPVGQQVRFHFCKIHNVSQKGKYSYVRPFWHVRIAETLQRRSSTNVWKNKFSIVVCNALMVLITVYMYRPITMFNIEVITAIVLLIASAIIFSERELMFTFPICLRPSVCLSSVCLSSVVCNVRAPYSGYWNFRQSFYAIWYLGNLWPFHKNFTEIVPGEPLRRGVKPKRGSKI